MLTLQNSVGKSGHLGDLGVDVMMITKTITTTITILK
jgi:hypothetical protein